VAVVADTVQRLVALLRVAAVLPQLAVLLPLARSTLVAVLAVVAICQQQAVPALSLSVTPSQRNHR